jgi:hypothetical protein
MDSCVLRAELEYIDRYMVSCYACSRRVSEQ